LDEARWERLNQRATPGVGRAHSMFLRKKCPFLSSYHISHQRRLNQILSKNARKEELLLSLAGCPAEGWYLESKFYAAAVLFHKGTGKKFTKQIGIN
jgi:hypothetical protein